MRFTSRRQPLRSRCRSISQTSARFDPGRLDAPTTPTTNVTIVVFTQATGSAAATLRIGGAPGSRRPWFVAGLDLARVVEVDGGRHAVAQRREEQVDVVDLDGLGREERLDRRDERPNEAAEGAAEARDERETGGDGGRV